jgi:hypothetical protein
LYPFAEQILAYKASEEDRRIGGLVLEVKGDFCNKIKEILARHGREEDIEIMQQLVLPLPMAPKMATPVNNPRSGIMSQCGSLAGIGLRGL